MDKREGSAIRLLHGDTSFPSTTVEEAIFSTTYVLDIFAENQLGVTVWAS
jgi:hypothetical protein